MRNTGQGRCARALQTELEDKLADAVLAGEIKAGDHVQVRGV